MNDITQFLMSHGGPVLFAVVFVEQAGLPLPSAPWLLAAGALSASGELNPALAIAVTALAAVLADSLWFYIGRRRGQRVLRLFCRLSLARNSCVGRTKGLFARYGLQALVAAKFLPGLGTVMPPLAGALGMRASQFFLFDGLGALFYGAFYIVGGFVFHNQLQQAMVVLKQVGLSALFLMLVLITGYIAFKYIRRRKPPSRELHHQSAASTKPEIKFDEPGTMVPHAQPLAVVFPGEILKTVKVPNVTLALTSELSERGEARSIAPLIGHPL